MLKNQKKIHKLILVAILIVISVEGCGKETGIDQSTNKAEIPTEMMQGSYAIDVDNPAEVVGSSDYTFVGYVDELIDTEYMFPGFIETETGDKKTSSPFTNYSITVLENIKGELPVGKSIPIQKDGGLAEDQSCYIIYERDSLPEVGKTYIFVIYTQRDGTLSISGPNSNILLDTQIDIKNRSSVDFTNSDVFNTYLDAYKNQIVSERKRSVSIYETNQN